VPGHELSGVVAELGYGTTGLTAGQRVFGLIDWTRNLQADKLEDVGEVDVVFDVIGGEIRDRSTALVRAGGTLVTTTAPPTVQPKDGRAMFFVVEPDRSQLADLAQRLRDGRLKPIVGAVRPLAEAPAAFAPDRRTPGKTIIRIIEGG
jgi:NADPH:quinone reductase-like Zn-dependent oxidoreductase